MKKRRLLVTGGAGFIGSHLVERLLSLGAEVRVLDNLSKGSLENLRNAQSARLFVGDILDPDAVANAVDGVDTVFHLAALTSVPESVKQPQLYHDVCANGTLLVLRLAAHAGVERVVYAASSSCYGDAGSANIGEGATLAPLSPYATAKLQGEYDCISAHEADAIETVRMRFFNVYGPRQDPRSSYAGVISLFADALRSGRRPAIYGDGEQTRDFVHVDDVTRALLLAGLTPGISGRVFNVGTGVATSVGGLLATMAAISNRDAIAEFRPERAGDVRHSCANVHAAGKALGFRARVPLAEGLRSLIDSNNEQRRAA
jgi:UDP-glucose 4-epimerase